MTRLIVSLAALAAFVTAASAGIKMSGTFSASKACPALQSIKKGSNPGNVSVEAGKDYALLARNNDKASHYWIDVPGAVPSQRWVEVSCGSVSAPAAQTGGAAAQGAGKDGGVPFYVLALSWEPSFCEGKPDKTECRNMQAGDAAARQLSLHGLWPQPARNAYCNVDPAAVALDDGHRWYDLPEVQLTPETKAALDGVMPGTQSVLERHEWIKHGTCYPGGSAETYFKDAVRLTQAVNGSAVGTFLAANVGKEIKTTDLRAKFDEAFGPGAGQRVRMACDRSGGRQIVAEITIGLKGDIPAGTLLPALMAASAPTDAGCPAGVLDLPGSN